ncbi:metallophosphoesterase [Limosilactobacillus fastidiosus]|uniref:Metallophosphoesterase n=1 Tax=Limosilactobacillus fastidiosus TaxID=2759855 RepID=A0ABR6E620_9LACO|nr:metallophosphoesterase [Limosilactobacillus fastidiosus]MBB1062639.1 metallophosphoesterase [Limosilactobacillus fastidiosus]MCD7083807.1 metallophosphoesterase [Limosilactobacillus fastidiosus]
MQFVTADTHFLDEHLLGIDKFAPRPFLTVEQMDQEIVQNWNELVGENDTVYHLGDIAVYFAKPQSKAYEKIFEILNSLNGHLVLIKGNHDNRGLFKYLAKNNYFFEGKPKFSFHDVGVLLKYDHCQYYLTHYPMMLGIAPQIINLHGHIHHYAVPAKENINVGIDSPEIDYLLPERVSFGAPLRFSQIEKIVNGKADDFTKRA